MLNISIVLYNTPVEEIRKIIKVLRISTYVNQIYLVDNSPSRSAELDTNGVEYIFNGKNLGFGAAHNLAIEKTISSNIKYHLILNPDVSIFENTIKNIVNYMEVKPEVGLLMPQVLYPDGDIQYLCKLLPAPVNLIFRRFSPFRKLVKRRNEKYELRFTGYDKEMEVPSLSGCFMFLRTSILEEIGGFDTRFFMYVEDVDLCRRIGQRSKTIYFPEAQIIHNYEKGSYRNRKLLYYHAISAIKYFNKWGWFTDRERKRVNNKVLQNLDFSQ